MRRLLGLAALVVVTGVLVFEAAMQPTAKDRAILYLIFASVTAVTALLGWAIPRWATRFRSLRTTVQVLALAAVAVAGAAVGASALSMFIDPHDLRLVLVALGLGLGLGITLAVAIARPLAADLEALAATARRVGSGDLSARSGIERQDEVGTVAGAIDDMIGQLVRARAEREQQEEARRHFLASIGHDLRTPLTALRAAVEALQDGIVPDPDRYLRSMARDVDLLEGLIDDLFLVARIEAGRLDLSLEDVDLAELADEAAEAMAPVSTARGVSVVVDVPGMVPARGEAQALGRVLRNLLDNAIRHSPEGGEVRVEVNPHTQGATVEVVDEGKGFPPEFAGRAFESFSRADPARVRAGGGAGLGLAIARGVVEAHGGRIWIGPGPGGRVGFLVPATTEVPVAG